MYLTKLYSEPNNLFPTIEFVDGINFIFGKKDSPDSKDSLNGIGKTLALDFLDFCLLSSETKLIKSAKDNNQISNYFIVLEFEVNKVDYIIKRSLLSPNKNIVFGRLEDVKNYENISDLRGVFCDLVFNNPKYPGKFSNTWFRKLIPFFVKKQKTKDNEYSDPVEYIKDVKNMELVQYHLFFLGLDNTLFSKNFNLQADLKKIQPAITEVHNIVSDTYGLKDIDQAENEVDKMMSQAKKLETNIKKFKLAEQYEDAEKQVNKLTEKIKGLWYQNYSNRKRVESYRESFRLTDNLDVRKIEKIYSDVNELLAQNIKKTLHQAIDFRKNVATSREKFLKDEIEKLEEETKANGAEISKLENERSQIFGFLEAKSAIADLSEAYLELSKKQAQISDISGKIKIYLDLKKEEAEIKSEEANLFAQITQFLLDTREDLRAFRQVFFDVHDAIYIENKEKSSFTLTPNNRKDAKVDFKVSLPQDLSKGKNQGRTLVYDLSVLFYAIKSGIEMPRFLVHDGIFDGMDKAHFVHLYEYMEKLKLEGQKFQYIVTLNEEGTLSENFGNVDKVTPEKIAREAILTLTPNTPLLGKRWD